MSAGTALSYCAHAVRTGDRDRFLSALLLPPVQREAVYALYAFNLEISRIPEAVSNEMIGHIRFAWWREALAELYTGAAGRQHAVVQALKPLIASGLPHAQFERLMDAREQQFTEPGFATTNAFMQYNEATSASLLTLCQQAIGDKGLEESAQHLGTAYAVLGHIRALGFHARAGRINLPEDLLAEYGVDREELLAGKDSPALRQVVRHLVDRLVIPPVSASTLLTGYNVLVRHYRRRLKKTGYNPFAPELEHGRGWLAFKLLCPTIRYV